MKYTLIVHAAPESGQASRSALRFAQALLKKGHDIHRLFFYGDAVHNGTLLNVTPQGETDVAAQWRSLIAEHQLDAVVCIAAALRRGIINRTEAERYERPSYNMAADFELSGLGQLLDATVSSDRVLTFGA